MTSELQSRQPGLNWKQTGLFFLAILLFTGAMFYRRADAFTNPQFWAEDGFVFFMEQDNTTKFLGFKNYNGYIHFLPRTVTYLQQLFSIPYEHVPTLYNYSTLFITIIYLCMIWFMLPYKASTKCLMIISAGYLPISAEIYMNLTNIQWFSSIGLVVLIFPINIRTYKHAILITLAVLFAGLTGPFSIILLPLFIIQFIKFRKSMMYAIPFGIAIITGIIQLIFLINHFQYRVQPTIPVPNNHLLLSIYNIIKQLFIPGSTTAPVFKSKHWIPIIVMAATIFFILVINIRQKKSYNLMVLSGIALIIIFTIYANWPYEWLLTPFGIGARYFFIPLLLSTWYIFVQFERKQILNFISMTIIILIFIVNGNRVKSRFIDFQWKKEVQEYYKTGDQVAPTNPIGWFIIFKKRNS